MTRTVRLVDGADQLYLRPASPSYTDPVWLTDFDPGSPAVREVKQNATGRSGTIDNTALIGARTITAKVKVPGDATRTKWQYVDDILGFCDPSRRPYLYEQRDGWTAERRYLLRPGPFSCQTTAKSAAYQEMSLSWEGIDGVAEAADLLVVAVYPPTVTAGLILPIAFDAAGVILDPGAAATNTIVNNPSKLLTPPLLRIYGQCTNPVITNRTTGRAMALSWTVPAGHYLDLDMGAQTAYMDSDPTLSVYGMIDWSQSSWWSLARDNNEITITAGSISTTCVLNVIYRPRWL